MRRIKNIGLAAIAVLALSAVGATAASAAEFEAETATATISSSNPYGLQAWTFHTASQHCDAPQLEGTLKVPIKTLEAGAKDAACYDNYTGFELKTNGCSLVHRLGVKTGAATFSGSVDIACPAGKTISFTGGVKTCKVDVPAQNNLPATYENVGAGSERAIKVTVNASGLKHSQVSGSDCGAAIGSYSDGSWSGSWKLQGSNGGPVGIWVKASEGLELPPSGIAVSGSPPALIAGTYPITITGQQKASTDHVFAVQWGTMKCTSAKFSSSISGASTQFTVTPEYGGCTWGGLSASVKTNGCTYTFNVLNKPPSGSTFYGHPDIACPAGKAIELVASAAGIVKCTATVPTQSPNENGLSFTNEAATSTIGLVVGMQGVDFHQQEGSGLGKCSTGDYTNGAFSGVSTLVGSY